MWRCNRSHFTSSHVTVSLLCHLAGLQWHDIRIKHCRINSTVITQTDSQTHATAWWFKLYTFFTFQTRKESKNITFLVIGVI